MYYCRHNIHTVNPAALFVKALMKLCHVLQSLFQTRETLGRTHLHDNNRIKEQVINRLNPYVFIEIILTKAHIVSSLIGHSVGTMHDSVCYKDSMKKSLNFFRTSNEISMALW